MTEKQARRLAIAGFGLWLAAHVFWVFRTEINWDEFALLARAHDSLMQGRLLGGGRPGLSTLLLIQIVEGCTNAVTTVVRARLAWTLFVAGILSGLWFTLVRLFHRRQTRMRDALWGVALLTLTPAFIHYSLQVRTDQPAIAFGLLGGVALLASRRHPLLAALAGLSFALGYASSQKLLYVVALVGVLAAAETFTIDRFRWRRDLLRTVFVVVAGALTVVVYRTLVSLFIAPAAQLDIGNQMSWFAFYREQIGYLYYVVMLPGLVVPVGLAMLVLVRVPIAAAKSGPLRSVALLVATIAALGLLVAGFHAGALPYFWMTLGLFPAVAVATGMPLLREWLSPSGLKVLSVLAIALLLATAAHTALEHSTDGLAVQRETMTLVDANFTPEREGFSTKRALFCRDGGEPFPTYFGPTLHEWTDVRVDEFIAEFRRRPVVFMIGSRDMEAFPPSVRQFWAEHYVPYAGSLLVPGVRRSTNADGGSEFDVIVPGEYTVHSNAPDAGMKIDGRLVRTADLVRLEVGSYRVELAQGTNSAMLALALPSPPGPTTDRFFTSH